ncbi:MAG: hypothetical protein AAF378_09215 [Cyanobacteria bacterium P01_A01_bin.84]
MNQNLRANSSKQTSKTPAIHPKLAASLASLEVQLERELARYRRSRIVAHKQNRASTIVDSKDFESREVESKDVKSRANLSNSNTLNNPTANLTQLQTQEKTPQNDLILNTLDAQDTRDTQDIQNTNAQNQEAEFLITETPTTKTQITKTQSPPPPPPIQPQPSELIAAQKAETKKVDTQTVETFTQKDIPQRNAQKVEDIVEPNSSSIVPTAVSETAESEETATTTGGISQQPPDDYLESSEALLRSLSEEKNQPSQPQRNKGGLLSPLGIGSIFLLIAAFGLVVYAAVNPDKFTQFNFAGKDTQEDDVALSRSTTNVNQPEITPIPKNPNLAAKEFTKINDPNDVVNLPTKAKATTKPSPNSVVLPPPQVEGSVQVPPVVPQDDPQSVPTDSSDSSTQQSVSQQDTDSQNTPQSDEDIKPDASGLYRVIIDNEESTALAKAKKLVPDAYLSDDKKFIYLGAMNTKEGAKKLLSELEAKGIKARVK